MSNFLGSVQPTGGLEIFLPKGKRIAPLRTFSTTSKQSFLSRTDCMKLELSLRPGENEPRHIGTEIHEKVLSL